MERVCWCPSSSAAGRRAQQWRRTTRQESSAMVATSMDTRRRSGKSSSTWRASVWAGWGADLGHFQAESDLGPKMKFAHLGLLYISHLSCQVIRALDQRIISVLIASVNGLTAITKLPKIDGQDKVQRVPSLFMLFAIMYTPTFIFGPN